MLVGFVQGLQLADVDVQAPEPPVLVSLRLDVYPPPQVLQTDGRFYHVTPASHVVGDIPNSRAPSLHGHYPASSLLRTPPPPSRRPPTSRGPRLYGLALLRRFRDGTRRASPVARRVLVTVLSLSPRRSDPPRQPGCDGPCCLRPLDRGLGLRGYALSGPPLRSLSLRPGDSLTILRMALSMGFRVLVSLLPAIRATGLLTLTLAGLTPAEHVSLRWTHG